MKQITEYVIEFKPTSKIRRFFKNIGRGLSYFKRGFHSADWDYQYLLGDILFKIKRMRDYANGPGVHILDKSEIDKLNEIYEKLIVCLELEIDDTPIYQDVYDMIEDIQMVDHPEDKNGYSLYEMKTTYVKGKTKEDYKAAMATADKFKEKNWNTFIKLLKTKIRHLWI